MISWSLNSLCFSPYNNMIIWGKLLLRILRALGESGTQLGWLFQAGLTNETHTSVIILFNSGANVSSRQNQFSDIFPWKKMRSSEQAAGHMLACVLVWRLQSNQPDYGSQLVNLTHSHRQAVQVFPWLLVPAQSLSYPILVRLKPRVTISISHALSSFLPEQFFFLFSSQKCNKKRKKKFIFSFTFPEAGYKVTRIW